MPYSNPNHLIDSSPFDSRPFYSRSFYSRLWAWRASAVVLLAGFLSACASTTSVEVDTSLDFPTPLVEAAPVHMGIYIPAEFTEYVYQEYQSKLKSAGKRSPRTKTTAGSSARTEAESDEEQVAEAEQTADAKPAADSDTAKDSETGAAQSEAASEAPEEARQPKKLVMSVTLGEAQTRMVRTVFPPVFRQATLLDSLERDAMPADMELYMVPHMRKLQYTTPNSTRQKVYEIWLQYDFNIYDRNGDLVMRWNLPSYGKTPSAFMKSRKDAMHAATKMALRDCGAAFSTGFMNQAAISRWFAGRDVRQQQAPLQEESE